MSTEIKYSQLHTYTEEQILAIQTEYQNAVLARKKQVEDRYAIIRKNREDLCAILARDGSTYTKKKAETFAAKAFPAYITSISSTVSYKNEFELAGKQFKAHNCYTLLEIWKAACHEMASRARIDNAKSAMTVACIKIATQKYPEVLTETVDKIVEIVTEKESKEYEDSLKDSELSCDCQECETWYVGDHRCSCGNCRIELIVDGDVISGFYGRGERY